MATPIAAVTTAPGAVSVDGARVAGGADGEAALHDAARDFVNATFFSMMMRAMRSTVPDDGLLSGGAGERVFRQQFDNVLVDRMAERVSTPLADALVRQVRTARAYGMERA